MSNTPGQLGIWLRGELLARGYDLQKGGQSRFARETGIHVSVISRVLNQDRGLEIDALRRVGAALNHSLGEMLVFAGMATPDELPIRDQAAQPATSADTAPAIEPEPVEPRRYDDDVLEYLWRTPDPGLSDEQRGALVQVYRAIKRTADPPRSGTDSASQIHQRSA